MIPTAALGPHITMRRAPHLSRMSRIAAVLLPLHTASLLPLGTRVAVAAPVWVWWPRTSPCSNRCTRDTEQHAPTAALAIPFSMPPSAALAPHITMRPALHTLSTIISFHRHDHIPSRSMYHSLLFLRGPFLDIPTRSSSRHFLHGFFAPHSLPGTLITSPSLPRLLLLRACTGYAARAMLHMLQLLHWPHRSACSNCCTGHTDQHAPNAALVTQISMLQLLHWPQGSACSTRTAAPLLKGGRRTTQ